MPPSVKTLRNALRDFRRNQKKFVKTLEQRQVTAMLRDWRYWARDDQLPPDGNHWRRWLILGGRGSGKTRAGAEWVRAIALGEWGHKAKRIALLAPTFAEARLVMIEGQSGLLSVHGADELPVFEPSKRLVSWANGTIAQVFTAEEPDGLRGPQFDAAWCDELAKWKQSEQVWNMLQFALRLGENPVAVITTTPRPIAVLKKILADDATVTSHSTTFDNAQNLASGFLRHVSATYGGTRLGRQELDGQMIEDDPDALFTREQIDNMRCIAAPELKRIVIGVDPPAGAGKTSNACGIVCVGVDDKDEFYVLADRTVQGVKPLTWAMRIEALHREMKASRIVAETNQGGAMVEQVLRQVNKNIPFRAVHASTGKKARAEPIAALYEQGRVHHVGVFAEMEDEMCSAIGEGTKSPDRLDALVWAIHELMQKPKPKPNPRVRMV
ncbi:MAG: DNA-packaging protein [Alphaproteobacteria bacterium]|nr:DNA-packaging protein [Alphaproteobacteria bacterium]